MRVRARRLCLLVPRRFAVTFDYRCPFARIAHDHVVTGLRGGAEWEVTFLPFSLGQAHVVEGMPDVWDEPQSDSGLTALQVGVAVRDNWPERFLDVHQALFEHRHLRAGSLRDRDAVGEVLASAGVDPRAVFDEVDSGQPLATVRDEHTAYVESHHVWGVPTFVTGSRAVFVRLMEGAGGDAGFAGATIERLLDQIEWPILNEFKHTAIPR